VAKQADADAFAKAMSEFSVFYQPASDQRVTALRARLLSRSSTLSARNIEV
jgi:hypothetical protein